MRRGLQLDHLIGIELARPRDPHETVRANREAIVADRIADAVLRIGIDGLELQADVGADGGAWVAIGPILAADDSA